MSIFHMFSKIFFKIILLSFLFVDSSYAGLNAFPRRVVLNDHQLSMALTLSHYGEKTSRYRIEFIDMGLDESGRLIQLSDEQLPEGYRSAKDFLRYSPKQITLKPGESQTVRILARRQRSMAAGEYRSYVLFRELLDQDQSVNDIEKLKQSSDRIQVKPLISMGLALPVIFHHGEIDGSAKVKSLTIDSSNPSVPVVNFCLSRQGNRSLYGEVVAEQDDGNGNITVVGIAKGLALYTPYRERTFKLPIDIKQLRPGTITISYRGLDGDAGKLFAQARIQVQ